MPKEQPKSPDPAEMTYEQALEAIEEIFEQIESGNVGFEESIALYERGRALLTRCREILNKAEVRLAEIDAATLDQSEPE